MLSQKFKDAIRIVSGKLSGKDLNWSFIGSTNCTLQGMNLSPKDLDLVVRLKDLEKIQVIFKDYNPSNVEKLFPDPKDQAWNAKLLKHPAWNVHFSINGVEVQILGGPDDGDYVSKLIDNRIIQIPFEEIKVPCFTLQTEIECYEETYRQDKADRIKRFLQLSNSQQ